MVENLKHVRKQRESEELPCIPVHSPLSSTQSQSCIETPPVTASEVNHDDVSLRLNISVAPPYLGILFLFQIWDSYFYLAVIFINQLCLQLEMFTPSKKKKVLEK